MIYDTSWDLVRKVALSAAYCLAARCYTVQANRDFMWMCVWHGAKRDQWERLVAHRVTDLEAARRDSRLGQVRQMFLGMALIVFGLVLMVVGVTL